MITRNYNSSRVIYHVHLRTVDAEKSISNLGWDMRYRDGECFVVFWCEYMPMQSLEFIRNIKGVKIQWDPVVIFLFSRSCGRRVFRSFGERSASIFKVTYSVRVGW